MAETIMGDDRYVQEGLAQLQAYANVQGDTETRPRILWLPMIYYEGKVAVESQLFPRGEG